MGEALGMHIPIPSYCVWGGVRDTQGVLDTRGEASASGRYIGSVELGSGGDGGDYDVGN